VNARSGGTQATLALDTEPRAAAFSASGGKVATMSSELRVWDLKQRVPGFRLMDGNARTLSRKLEFSRDESLLACVSNNTVYVWQTGTGKTAMPPLNHGDAVTRMIFSDDSRRLLTTSRDNAVHIWEARSGRPLVAPLRHEAGILNIAEGLDGSVRVICRDHTVTHWSLLNTAPPTIGIASGGVSVIGFSGDGKWLVTGHTSGGGARLWDARTARPLPVVFPHEEGVVDARFSDDSKCLITADAKSVVRVWKVGAGELVGGPMVHQTSVRSAQLSADGQRALVGLDHGVCQVWNVASGACLYGPFFTNDNRKFRASGSAHGPATFGREGTLVLYGRSDSRAVLLDFATGKEVASLKHGNPPTWCRYSGDGRRMITSSRDMTARVWEVPGGRPVTGPLRHEGTVNVAALSADGRLAVTASEDRTARVWDAVTGQPLTVSLVHAAPVSYAEFSPDAARVLTVAVDGTVHLWNVRTGQRLRDPVRFAREDAKASATFSPDGSSIALRSRGTAFLWRIEPVPGSVPDWLPTLAETLGGQRIDAAGDACPVRPGEVGQLRQSVLDRPVAEFYAREIRALFE
jgi:WD40 repeat protein